MGGKIILANLSGLQHLRILKAYVWGKVEVLVALGRRDSFLSGGGALLLRAMCFSHQLGRTGRFGNRSNFFEGGALLKLIKCRVPLSHFLQTERSRRCAGRSYGDCWGAPRTVGIGFELGQSTKDYTLEMLIIIWGFPHVSMTEKEVVIEAATRSCCT